ncbi:MAG: hypothetical protein KA793_01750 [Bacteroidales bacterium]|nr:hypothetical protein [Bacteroidales bacterium]
MKWIDFLFVFIFFVIAGTAQNPEKILDHEVVLKEGKLQPWTEYNNVLRWSMNYLENCPSYKTKFGDDPLYLVTSKLYKDGSFCYKQNNQGSNVYWGMETFKRYYAYTGDTAALDPVRKLIQRVAYYHTPSDWVWADVPRTQDDTPDGEYTDEWSGVDKICMVALGYLDYFRFTGEKQYFVKAETIAKTILAHVKQGDKKNSPIPFMVNLKTGKILDTYCSNMILPLQLFDELSNEISVSLDKKELKSKRDLLWRWILDYPMKNNHWSGYYEDVSSNYTNLNQQNPMETARYILKNPGIDPDYKIHIPALIQWVENRFGQVKRFGATSIKEQDGCFKEMSSHTARYASVVAKWYGVCLDEGVREEARASFALSTYSAYNQYSKNHQAINYTGIEYIEPWFSDSYWDYLPHILDGMAELPDMLPPGEDHIFYSSSMITKVDYSPGNIAYTSLDKAGTERIKLTFVPEVFSNGKLLNEKYWSFGDFRGINNVLIIKRLGVNKIEIRKK